MYFDPLTRFSAFATTFMGGNPRNPYLKISIPLRGFRHLLLKDPEEERQKNKHISIPLRGFRHLLHGNSETISDKDELVFQSPYEVFGICYKTTKKSSVPEKPVNNFNPLTRFSAFATRSRNTPSLLALLSIHFNPLTRFSAFATHRGEAAEPRYECFISIPLRGFRHLLPFRTLRFMNSYSVGFQSPYEVFGICYWYFFSCFACSKPILRIGLGYNLGFASSFINIVKTLLQAVKTKNKKTSKNNSKTKRKHFMP